jgi:hypothetical protein
MDIKMKQHEAVGMWKLVELPTGKNIVAIAGYMQLKQMLGVFSSLVSRLVYKGSMAYVSK